jgi:hypothetical protein
MLKRPRFETSEDEIHKIVLALIQTGEVVSVRSNFKVVKHDPDDDAIARPLHAPDCGTPSSTCSRLVHLFSEGTWLWLKRTIA